MRLPVQLVIDCRQPDLLVGFWQHVLGYEIPPPPEGHDTWRAYYLAVGQPPESIIGDGADRLEPADGDGFSIWFQAVPELKTVKNRLHLDVMVSPEGPASREERRLAIEAAIERLEGHGGRVVHRGEDDVADHVFAVMADPEGNEFCLV